METITLQIDRCIVYSSDGNALIHTPVDDINLTGRWKFTAAQIRRMANGAGIVPEQIGILKPEMDVVGEWVKAGQSFVDRDGTVLSYTKAHFRIEDHLLVLNAAAQQSALIAALSVASMRPARPRPVVNTNLQDPKAIIELKAAEDAKAEAERLLISNPEGKSEAPAAGQAPSTVPAGEVLESELPF